MVGRTNAVLKSPKHYLYKNGDEYTNITGGWIADEYTGTQYIQNYAVAIKQSNYINIINTPDSFGGAYTLAIIGTINKIDVSQYSKLKINVSSLSATQPASLYLMSAKTIQDRVNASKWDAVIVRQASISSTGVVEMNISDIGTQYYIGFGTKAINVNYNFDVDAVWLE